MPAQSSPLDGNAVVLAAAKASISGDRLPGLIASAQCRLAEQRDEYVRRFECVHEDDAHAVFLVENGHWETFGEEHEFARREWKALRRAHREHLTQLGGELDCRAEFETALEVREAVVIG